MPEYGADVLVTFPEQIAARRTYARYVFVADSVEELALEADAEWVQQAQGCAGSFLDRKGWSREEYVLGFGSLDDPNWHVGVAEETASRVRAQLAQPGTWHVRTCALVRLDEIEVPHA